jgi:plasmid stability protein
MAILHVRNVPDEMYQRIQKLAEEEDRSLTAEVIQLLAQGLKAHDARRGAAAVVARIRREAEKVELPKDWTDAANLVREDRER